MRAHVFFTIFALFSAAAFAQQPPASPKLFASSADVTALVERAKRERKPDQANFIQPIVQLAPYNANLEYRVAGLPAAATAHEREGEMFYVVDGAGTVVTGGTLREEKRMNAENRSGSAIDGGTPRRITKGDWVMVPPNTPHWFSQIEGTLVMMSIHLPIPSAAPASSR